MIPNPLTFLFRARRPGARRPRAGRPDASYRIAKSEDEKRENSSAALKRFFEALPHALWLLDGEARILLWNKAAKHLCGTMREGDHISSLMRAPEISDLLLRVGEEALPHVDYQSAVPIERHFRATASRIDSDPTSRRPHILLLVEDHTEIHQMQRIKRDFVGDSSHQLKTPLAVIGNVVEALSDKNIKSKDRTHFYKILEKQVGRMRDLVGALLSLNRVETLEHRRPTDRIHLMDLLDDVMDARKGEAEKRGIDLTFSAAPDLPPILGERKDLLDVFENLLENAFVHGVPEGGRVSVRLERAGEKEILFEVADSGLGMADEHIPRLTERFYRILDGRDHKGTGLGLAIVKHILVRHQGRMRIESVPNEGSRFSVWLPVA